MYIREFIGVCLFRGFELFCGVRPRFESRRSRETSFTPKVSPVLLDSDRRVLPLLKRTERLDEVSHTFAMFHFFEWRQRRLYFLGQEAFNEKAGKKEEIIGTLRIDVGNRRITERSLNDIEACLKSRENVERVLVCSPVSKHDDRNRQELRRISVRIDRRPLPVQTSRFGNVLHKAFEYHRKVYDRLFNPHTSARDQFNSKTNTYS